MASCRPSTALKQRSEPSSGALRWRPSSKEYWRWALGPWVKHRRHIVNHGQLMIFMYVNFMSQKTLYWRILRCTELCRNTFWRQFLMLWCFEPCQTTWSQVTNCMFDPQLASSTSAGSYRFNCETSFWLGVWLPSSCPFSDDACLPWVFFCIALSRESGVMHAIVSVFLSIRILLTPKIWVCSCCLDPLSVETVFPSISASICFPCAELTDVQLQVLCAASIGNGALVCKICTCIIGYCCIIIVMCRDRQ